MRTSPLRFEPLEDRAVPATFGMPWADPARLTLSFAPDGTPVAGRTSDLFAGLNRDRSENEWQLDVVRAFHTWAQHTNIDVAVVPDDGPPFGTPGRLQGDARFGDVRVGGNRLTRDVLAVTSPPDPALAGTLAGDVFVNTAYRFKDTPYDLYSVMLHEAGHALGLNHSTNPQSPMFPRFNNTRTGLTAGDITAIRALYGPRVPDRFEGPRGNGTTATAAPLPKPTAYTGATPLLGFADITTAADADVFHFDTILGRDEDDDGQNITVRVRTAGISLLAPQVTVYYLDKDGKPQEVANAKADSSDFDGSEVSVTFDGNDDDDGTSRRYFIRVESVGDAPFRVGRYVVSMSFDGLSTVSPADLDRVSAGPYRSVSANDLAALLRAGEALVNVDGGTNETPAAASALSPNRSTGATARYEVVGSLTAGDADVYRVVAPAGTGPRVFTVTAVAAPGGAPGARVQLLDATGAAVPAEVLVNDTGAYTVQATGLTAGAAYFVRVTGGGAGNYLLTADFGAVATDVRTFAEGEVAAGAARTDTLFVGQAQLFHFALTVDPTTAPPGAALRVTITDAAGRVVFVLAAEPGQTVSAPAVLLRPGEYRVRYEVVGTTDPAVVLAFRLRGNRVTDPVGPVAADVTLVPEYRSPSDPKQFLYPVGVLTLDPFYWFVGLR